MAFNLFNSKNRSIIKADSDIPLQVVKDFNKTRPHKATGKICNAPFRNLYLAPDGNAYVCCYNQKYSLGKYPEKSFKEIWNSETLKIIRQHINNYNLSYGCDECKSALMNGQFLSAHISLYDCHFGISEFPTFIEFQLENTCNLECSMCNGELSSGIANHVENRVLKKNIYDKHFIQQLVPFIPYLKNASFSGGESFIIPTYYDIWQMILEKNPDCVITIQTNGTILNQKVKDILNKGKFSIGISLDSLNETTYSHIRKNAVLKNTLENISYFRDYCKTNQRFIGISVCPMQQNWEEMPDILEFCNKNEMEIYFNTVWFPGKSALWILDSVKIKEIVTYYSNKTYSGKSKIQKKNILTFQNLINMLTGWQNVAEKWEKHKPVNIPQDEIKNLENTIIERIKVSAGKIINDDTLNKSYIQKNLVDKTTAVFSSLPDNDLKLKSLQIISGYHDEKIVSDILREEDQGLFQLIKNLYRIQDL